MRKHNEGYTLVLVLVVMVVLCLVSMSIMTFSLRNLQNQQASVERMEAKYQAQGEIEKIMGQLEQAYTCDSVDTELKDEHEAVLHWFSQMGIEHDENGTNTIDDEKFIYSAMVRCDSTKNDYDYSVKSVVNISGEIEIVKNDITQKITGYRIYDIKVEYTSYEIGGGAA